MAVRKRADTIAAFAAVPMARLNRVGLTLCRSLLVYL
jgi:hypothetical protein